MPIDNDSTEETWGDTENPVELQQGPGPAYESDRYFYRIVVFSLSIALILSLIGSLYLAASGKENIPDIFIAASSGAIGALAGVITSNKNG